MDILKTKTNMVTLDEYGRWKDCPNEQVCVRSCNPSCPQYPVKTGTSHVGSLQLVQQLSNKMTPEEVLRLWQEGKLLMLTNSIRRCAVCGKVVTSGYVWDDLHAFCSEDCAVSVFDGDSGCFNILVDDGRIKWQDEFR